MSLMLNYTFVRSSMFSSRKWDKSKRRWQNPKDQYKVNIKLINKHDKS